jgi:hypothetical protein
VHDIPCRPVPLGAQGGLEGGEFHAVLMDFGSTKPARVEVFNRAEAMAVQEDAEVGSLVLRGGHPNVERNLPGAFVSICRISSCAVHAGWACRHAEAPALLPSSWAACPGPSLSHCLPLSAARQQPRERILPPWGCRAGTATPACVTPTEAWWLTVWVFVPQTRNELDTIDDGQNR